LRRNCPIKHVAGWKIERTRRRGRRSNYCKALRREGTGTRKRKMELSAELAVE
jgi:hypothetical protein